MVLIGGCSLGQGWCLDTSKLLESFGEERGGCGSVGMLLSSCPFQQCWPCRAVCGGLQENAEGCPILAWWGHLHRAVLGAGSAQREQQPRAALWVLCCAGKSPALPVLQCIPLPRPAFVLLKPLRGAHLLVMGLVSVCNSKIGLRWQLKSRNSTV